jgi:polyhydroxybutyrate depolymerase
MRHPIIHRSFLLSIVTVALTLVTALSGCSTVDEPQVAGVQSPDEGDLAPSALDDGAIAEGPRPDAILVTPAGYDPDQEYPLVVVLHGYEWGALAYAWYFQFFQLQAESQDFLLLLPNGMENSAGSRYWEATDSCCDDEDLEPGDLAWLRGQIKKVHLEHNVSTIGVFGFGNGAFMAEAMVCQPGSQIDAIAALNGTTYADESLCNATNPVSVLHIHGTANEVIPFDGLDDDAAETPFTGGYPGVDETIERWLDHDGCVGEAVVLDSVDLDAEVEGDETVRESYACEDSTVELWAMEGSGHVPAVDVTFAEQVVDWLNAD